MNESNIASLMHKVEMLDEWLIEKALPLWISAGFDSQGGGFYERIGQDGAPMVADNRRARVQPRQVYCFTAGGGRGFTGDWQHVSQSGLAYFEKVYRRKDGLFGALASPESLMIDETFDLYNQAFALFAFAQYARAFPASMPSMETAAVALLEKLKAEFKHPLAGFEEANPVKLPLCSNPHMHLFEAALAWETVAAESRPWSALADEIANLAMTKFIDGKSGGLREFFDHDWNPSPDDKGRIMEPGHQFEWAWLLARWGNLRNDNQAIGKAGRLFEIGMTYGLSPDGKVAVMSLYDDFSVHDPIARMWPQTEWLKASTLLARLSTGETRVAYLAAAEKACDAFQLFLQTPVGGLWYDKRRPDGSLVDEPAPASTFYHILCAIYEAQDNLKAT
jgi:mannose/cellobiose epimerase-like protein (N-acyl-D-glucosamine 2-epimerase family)